MPNDCYNYLEAPEERSLITDYISTAKREWSSLPDTFLDFEKILPTYEDRGKLVWLALSEYWNTRSILMRAK